MMDSPRTYFETTQLRGHSFKILSSFSCERLEVELEKAAKQSEELQNDIPIAVLMQLQDICTESMKIIEAVQQSDLSSDEHSALLLDVLRPARIALLIGLVKQEALELQLQSHDILRLCLRVLTDSATVSRNDIWNEVAQNLKTLNRIAAKMGLDEILPSLQTLLVRILHPQYTSKKGTGLLIESAVELTFTIFFHYPEERRDLIADAISITMAYSALGQDSYFNPSKTKLTHRPSFLFTNFVHLSAVASRTGDSDDSSSAAVPQSQMNCQSRRTADLGRQLEAARVCAQTIICDLVLVHQSSQSHHSILLLLCEDLVQLVGSPQCAGAELLLRCLFTRVLHIIKNNGCQLRLKVLALELLKIMGEAIASVYDVLQKSAIAEQLIDCHGSMLEIYRIVMEHLWWNFQEDNRLRTARAYLATVYAYNASSSPTVTDIDLKSLEKWPEQPRNICPKLGETAYFITLLATGFFQSLRQIIIVLRDESKSNSAGIRLKSWKGLLGIFDKKANVIVCSQRVVHRCLRDSSVKVREASLAFFTDNREWMTSLAENAERGLTDDSSTIRKQFIKFYEKLYVAESNFATMAVCHLLRGVGDKDASVALAANKALERLWLQPERTMILERAHENALDVMNTILERYPCLEDSLCQYFASGRKAEDFASCKLFATAALRKVQTSIEKNTDRRPWLRILAVLTKANGSLFGRPPNSLLLLYINRSKMEFENTSFKYVTSMLSCLVKCNPDFDTNTLALLERTLLELLPVCKGDGNMDHVTRGLWASSDRLKSYPRLFNLILSLEQQISAIVHKEPNVFIEGMPLAVARRLISLIGFMGKNFFLETHQAVVESGNHSWYPRSIMLSLLKISQSQLTGLNRLALHSLCRFCHSWPEYMSHDEIIGFFDRILTGNDVDSQIIVLEALLACLLFREQQPTRSKDFKVLDNVDYTPQDTVAFTLNQRCLSSILLLAMRGHCKRTLVATEYIATVSRQGLVSPSKVYPILVALGTTQESNVAVIANREHTRMHNIKVSVVETSYVDAFRMSFLYQQEFMSSPSGISQPEFRAKLHHLFRAINDSQKRSRNRFFRQTYTELLSAMQDDSDVAYLRYLVENLTLYPFIYFEDLQQNITQLKEIIYLQHTDVLPIHSSDNCPTLSITDSETQPNVAIAIVWEGYKFFQAEATMSKGSENFVSSILKYHHDQGAIFVDSMRALLNLNIRN